MTDDIRQSMDALEDIHESMLGDLRDALETAMDLINEHNKGYMLSLRSVETIEALHFKYVESAREGETRSLLALSRVVKSDGQP